MPPPLPPVEILSAEPASSRRRREPANPPVMVATLRPPAPPAPPRRNALPFKLRPVSPWSFEAYRGHILSRTPARVAARPPVPPPWMMSLPPATPASIAPVALPSEPASDADDSRCTAEIAPKEGESRTLLFVMIMVLAGTGWYAAAVRYQTEQASTHAAPATQVAAETPEVPASSVTSPRAAPVRGAVPASFTPVTSTSSKPAAPKVEPRPQARAEPKPEPKKAAPPPPMPMPKPDKPAATAQSASMEKTLQAAKQETETTLN